MKYQRKLLDIFVSDPVRWSLLQNVRSLDLPDCWIGAGFIRNAVWDYLHDIPVNPPKTDIDVIWFDSLMTDIGEDKRLEAILRHQKPDYHWSVKNQARMHARNGDDPYRSSPDALRYWPETATAVAVRLTAEDSLEIAAPCGLADLFELRLAPTPHFLKNKMETFKQRVADKRWLDFYPLLLFEH